eukprot:6446110-Pyramimonas_sp.AAC.1
MSYGKEQKGYSRFACSRRCGGPRGFVKPLTTRFTTAELNSPPKCLRLWQLAEATEAAEAKGQGEEEAKTMAELVKDKERTIAALQLQVRKPFVYL